MSFAITTGCDLVDVARLSAAIERTPGFLARVFTDHELRDARRGGVRPGSTVERATLHNLDEVRRKDVRIGDHVVLHKAGDVIPEVVRVIAERRTGDEREFQMPASCPICDTPVVRDPDAVRHYCPNTLCPARVGKEFGHFVSRGGMDIEGAGWSTLEQLLQRGLVKSRGDFFRLKVRGLEKLPRQGPYIICPNHQSYLDPFFLVAALPYRVLRQIFFVGASEYFATPRMRRIGLRCGRSPVVER